MCKLTFKNIRGSFSDTEEEWFVETVYFRPIYIKDVLRIKTNMPTFPEEYSGLKNRSWRINKRIIQMWMR